MLRPEYNQVCWKLYQYDKITHEELRYKRLKNSFDAINYAISDEEIDEISIDYIRFLPENNHLFDGAIELLEYLKPNYNLHIITNGFADVQFKKINNSKIANFFHTVTNSEMAGVKKPNPTIFDFALDLAKAKKENSIMIGDSLDADVQGALDAGLDAIYFNEKNIEEYYIREILKEETNKTISLVLNELSLSMKNKFERSDA
mgnify:CR=1 FL=1